MPEAIITQSWHDTLRLTIDFWALSAVFVLWSDANVCLLALRHDPYCLIISAMVDYRQHMPVFALRPAPLNPDRPAVTERGYTIGPGPLALMWLVYQVVEITRELPSGCFAVLVSAYVISVARPSFYISSWLSQK